MKRICSLLLVICFVFAGTTVFGAGYDKLFDALSNTVYSGEFEMSAKGELNSPLLIADVLSEQMFGGDDVPVDLKLLLEGLLSSEISAECKYNVSKDFLKADLYLSCISSNPIEVNESLKIAAWSKWDIWMQYDFASETPVYKIILKTPVSKKYVVMDLSSQLQETPLAAAKLMPDAEQTLAVSESVMALYKENAEVSKISGGYRMKLDDAGFKNLFIGLFDIMSGLMSDQYLKMGMPESDITEINAQLEQVKAAVESSKDKFSIIGKDGFVYDMKVNTLGFITEGTTSLNIGLNVYDIMTALGAEEECSEAGITKENSCIDFTFKVNEKHSNHNKNVKIQYPVLTGENSFEVMNDSYAVPEDYASAYHYFSVIEDGVPMIINSVPYVKLRGAAEECGFDISYADGIVYVDTKTSDGKLELKLNSNELTRNGEKTALADTIIEKNGTTYVSSEILSYISIEFENVSYDAESNLTYSYLSFTNPDMEEPAYEEETYVEVVEEGLSEYFWVESDTVPVVENDVIYIPLYPLVEQFNVTGEEITAAGGEILIESDDSYIFRSLKLNENSIFTEKDGVQLLIDNPVKNVGGSLWVGTDFAEKVLNSKLIEVYYSPYYGGATYDFERTVK